MIPIYPLPAMHDRIPSLERTCKEVSPVSSCFFLSSNKYKQALRGSTRIILESREQFLLNGPLTTIEPLVGSFTVAWHWLQGRLVPPMAFTIVGTIVRPGFCQRPRYSTVSLRCSPFMVLQTTANRLVTGHWSLVTNNYFTHGQPCPLTRYD